MSVITPRPVNDPWRDAQGTHIALFRIEQIAVNKEHGVLPSRLHQQGRVINRGHNRLYVRFDDDNQLISLRPHLVRVLDAPRGC
jgi:hypothetical protein